MSLILTLLFLANIITPSLLSECDLFLENKICEIKELVDSIENVPNELECQNACASNSNCGNFTWINFKTLPPTCYLYSGCENVTECFGECAYSLSGPLLDGVSWYPGTCCTKFNTGNVCEKNSNNILAGIPYIYDAASCQDLCQDTGLYPDCKYFIFDSKWSTCVLLSSCFGMDERENAVSGPVHPSINFCSELSPVLPTTSSTTTTTQSTTPSPGPKPVQSTALLLGGAETRNGSHIESSPCELKSFAELKVSKNTNPGAAVLNGEVYLCGGFADNYFISECYKNVPNDWAEVPPMYLERSSFSMNTIGGKILVAGGLGTTGYMNSMEIFDGTSWTLLSGELQMDRNIHCAVPISDHEIVFLGGSNFDKISLVDKYDLNTNTWENMTEMTSPRFSHACILKGTDIIVTGGYSDGYLNTTEALDTLSWTWSPLPDLQLSRSYHTMELVNDKIMVFGGSDAQNSSETFDGTAWTVETLAHKHIYHASVTVPCA
ncbi:kelch-like protein 38 [Eurytemora carolleeae]|uniref:kelch-like protein 38 n=1 Tax=Eurytemora carolleeae TaxID=1294199 RepID=UPI000C75ACA2|nr:kelch-like protein 38 [Eurytemora carolleeae]|eukprot:XP_023332298.1 kelch-like protein 38 [Eurytemora affinis]